MERVSTHSRASYSPSLPSLPRFLSFGFSAITTWAPTRIQLRAPSFWGQHARASLGLVGSLHARALTATCTQAVGLSSCITFFHAERTHVQMSVGTKSTRVTQGQRGDMCASMYRREFLHLSTDFYYSHTTTTQNCRNTQSMGFLTKMYLSAACTNFGKCQIQTGIEFRACICCGRVMLACINSSNSTNSRNSAPHVSRLCQAKSWPVEHCHELIRLHRHLLSVGERQDWRAIPSLVAQPRSSQCLHEVDDRGHATPSIR